MESQSNTQVNQPQSLRAPRLRRWHKSACALAVAAALAGGGAYGILQHEQLARAADAATQPQATHDQIRKAQDLSTVFRTVGKQVEQSVVNINVRKTVKGIRRPTMPDDDFFKRFFPNQELPDNGKGDEKENTPDEQGDDQMEQVGTGSGVIMEVDGNTAYILTNNHVAGGAEEMLVTLNDGRQISKAKLVGADPKSDLAVVEIHGDNLPPAAKWGNSDDLQQGDWIMAFGSPFGYVGSMTHGIISALNRTNVGILGQQGYEDFIQVDAPINPGNSGGPLVNLYGEVVGINTAIASRSGGFQGIGFAIPANSAKFVYQQIKDHGKVVRGWLGVSIADVSHNLDAAKAMGYDANIGVLIEQTFENTPASGKLQPGDIVTELNGKQVENVLQLRNAIAAIAPNTEITLKVFRAGKTQDESIKLGTQPEDVLAATGRPGQEGHPGANADSNVADALGMRLSTLTDELSQKYNLADVKQGALITAVSPRSAAGRAGLRAGDVITNVNKQKVASAQDAADDLKKADLSKGILLYVASRDGSRFVFLRAAQ